MMENHSFDNIFGIYPTASGNLSSIISQITVPLNLISGASARLTQIPGNVYATANPVESREAYQNDWDNGKNDGFASSSGPQSMTYFSSAQFALEWDWAEQYSIGDMYFSSYLSQTTPNRLMSLAGFTPVTANYGPPPSIPVNSSIFSELSTHNISWKYYIDGTTGNNYPLNYFDWFDALASNLADWQNFYADARSNTLPSVSWMSPLGGYASGIDQHPSENVLEGELWLLNVVNSVMSSSSWSSSAILVTYDEGGGYYDQVSPPSLDGIQFGFRVPFIVISPFAKEDYVSSTVLNHASMLAFIDYNWKLPALNGFVGDSNLPLDLFSFNSTLKPMILNQSSTYPVVPQIPFADLPYARNGSSSATLSKLSNPSSGGPLFSSLNYEFAAVVLLIITSALAGFAIKRRNELKRIER